MHTPFFPAFRPRLAACRQSVARKFRRASLAELDSYMASIFPAHLLSQADEGLNSRDRIFTLRLTLQCFLYQVLNPGTSCREVVRHVQALIRAITGTAMDEGTSAYCQARKRLPLSTIKKLLHISAQTADRRAGAGGQINGRPVKLVDCSSAKAADTPANQKRFPQPSEQKPGCGFPVIRLLVLYSLKTSFPHLLSLVLPRSYLGPSCCPLQVGRLYSLAGAKRALFRSYLRTQAPYGH